MTGHMIWEPGDPEHICKPPKHISYATEAGSGCRSPKIGAVWQCDCGRFYVLRTGPAVGSGVWVKESRASRWWRHLRGREVWKAARGPNCAICGQSIYEGQESYAQSSGEGVTVRHIECRDDAGPDR
jgi:hypothetical protein